MKEDRRVATKIIQWIVTLATVLVFILTVTRMIANSEVMQKDFIELKALVNQEKTRNDEQDILLQIRKENQIEITVKLEYLIQQSDKIQIRLEEMRNEKK